MTVNIKQPSKRVTTAPLPNTQVSSRNDIFNKEEQVDEEALGEDAKRMDLLMRQLMGDDHDEEEKEVVVEEEAMEVEEAEEEEAFSFRLFSNQTVSTVKIADEKDTTDHLSKLIADQQVYEFDETDPEFLARVNQAVVDYETILKQSTIPYPTLRQPRRVIHISSTEQPKVEKKKKRKSKKCRDFDKAVKEGKIVLKENMRKSENGWPGWPGTLTRVAIINYQSGKKSHSSFGGSRGGGRGNFRGGMSSRGSRGSFRGGRGRSF